MTRRWRSYKACGVVALAALVYGGVALAQVFSQPPASRPPATVATVPAAGVGDTATMGWVALTLHAIQDPAPRSAASPPLVGYRWVALDIELANIGPRRMAYNARNARLLTRDARAATLTRGGPAPTLAAGTLGAGEAVRGWVTFAVPQDAELARFTYQPSDLSGVRLRFTLRP